MTRTRATSSSWPRPSVCSHRNSRSALELNQDKTLITHARTDAARFLGYEITAHHDHSKGARGRRWTDGFIKLNVPRSVIKAKIAQYKRGGKPAARTEMTRQDDYTIVATFGAEHRGFVQYYLLAGNVYHLRRLEWFMQSSMLRTLAHKHRSSVNRMTARHKAKIQTPHGLRTCFEATIERPGRTLVARFGGIPLKRRKDAVPYDHIPNPAPHRHREVARRLARGQCELCGRPGPTRVHQVRKLADLEGREQAEQPEWMATMARMRRNTLMVCGTCHDTIHSAPPKTA